MTSRPAVERVTGMSAALAALASRTQFSSHRWIRPDSPANVAALTQSAIAEAIGRNGNQMWSAGADGDVNAVAVLRPLSWDSSVLGLPAARIDLFTAGDYSRRHAAIDAVLPSVLSAARADRLRHLSVRVDASEDAAIHALERHGFLNVDALMTFGLELTDTPGAAPPERVRGVLATEHHAVGEIAAEAFRDGRFHADPTLDLKTARRVYRTWAVACCEGTAADAVLVATGPSGIRGFVACRMQPETAAHLERPAGAIVMIATAAVDRGQGIGADLIGAAHVWFRTRQAVASQVGTQLRNVAAARLYERCGYRLVSGSLSFRTIIES